MQPCLEESGTKPITVFYGTLVVGQYDNMADLYAVVDTVSDIYQGGYCYYNGKSNAMYTYAVKGGTQRMGAGWYRLDGTPCILEDVPKELRTLALLMNL